MLISKPEVSVLMPVYNAALFLKAALDSILNQSFKNFELILINDGSTDGSQSVIEQFKDERIRYYYKPNSGVADSLNFGLQKVTGKYIWRHDADDVSLPDKLASQVNFLEDHPEFSLCSTQIAFMTERGKIAWDFKQPKSQFFEGREWVEVVREQFNPYSPITHATILIRTDVIKTLGGYRTAFKTAEDVDLWLRLLNQYRAVVLNQCDYFVRLNKASATQVHGWKNTFFRNLAFEYFDQRKLSGLDDLERGSEIVLPSVSPYESNCKLNEKGKVLRSDLLNFHLPLNLNAKDWYASFDILKLSILAGWKLKQTWKMVFVGLLGSSLTKKIVSLKKELARIKPLNK